MAPYPDNEDLSHQKLQFKKAEGVTRSKRWEEELLYIAPAGSKLILLAVNRLPTWAVRQWRLAGASQQLSCPGLPSSGSCTVAPRLPTQGWMM